MADADQIVADNRKNLPAAARSLIATARNDITIPHFTTVLQTIDDTLIQRGGGKGLKIYDEIERDTHAYAVLQKRKFAMVAREWIVEPASEAAADKAAAQMVGDILSSLNFDQLCLDLLDATLKGYSVAEILWTRQGAMIRPADIVAHDARRFVFDEGWAPRLLTYEANLYGIELPERKFIVHRFGVKGNNPYGLGLGSKLFWPVLFKREGIAFWLTFLEKFASPTPVGKYPLGTLPADQNTLLNNLEGMAQAGAIVLPIGAELSFLEATRSGNVSYKEWCAYWDIQMALCVFGSALATYVEGQGSRAAAETHKEGEEQIIDADADLLSDTLRKSLIQWLVDFNAPGAGVPTVKRIRPKNELAHEELRAKRAGNMKAELERLLSLASLVPPESFAEIAAALAGADLMPAVPADILKKLAPFLVNAKADLAAIGGKSGQDGAGDGGTGDGGTADPSGNASERAPPSFAEAGAHDHGVTDLADQLGPLAESHIRGWLGRIETEIEAAIAGGQSLSSFSERLLAIYPELTLDGLGNAIMAASATAELSGRADVKDEMAAKKRKA